MAEFFVDERGNGRTMRVSRHPDRGVAVVSIWAGGLCRASFRLPLSEVDRVAEVLCGADPDAIDPMVDSMQYPGLAPEIIAEAS
ncbi:hypothetical protein Val02_41350 [Virgisporangium aliadipatigenens]|uniref:Uncharacterized protein n=1 Tax=Virgisporangium aliadipatigenens TaxID=741659 RepID=A0A8J3YKR4_9ACTN|nr:hypothetical protein [Virgisporangium aliadipatigenens]GIJ47249.1 hypothetical protein Val02_41350 [Virgisporangium aliadipatigenens]